MLILPPIIYDVISFHEINICIPQFSNLEDCFKKNFYQGERPIRGSVPSGGAYQMKYINYINYIGAYVHCTLFFTIRFSSHWVFLIRFLMRQFSKHTQKSFDPQNHHKYYIDSIYHCIYVILIKNIIVNITLILLIIVYILPWSKRSS